MAILRRKLDRVKKIEMANSADEVLQEEIREYKVKTSILSFSTNRFITESKHYTSGDSSSSRWEIIPHYSSICK